jgi:uncharacterized protein (TIGR03067 family)
MKLRLLALVAVGALVGVGVAQDTDVKKEMKKFEGEWKIEKYEGPMAPPEDEQAKVRFIFKGDTVTLIVDGKKVGAATFKIDPSKKPKTIDLDMTEGKNKGKTSLAFYAFEGETLKWCATERFNERPTEFKASEENKQGVLTLKRIKS